MSSIWKEGWSGESYWLDGLGPAPMLPTELPAEMDVVIIGSGYTGLNAAIEFLMGHFHGKRSASPGMVYMNLSVPHRRFTSQLRRRRGRHFRRSDSDQKECTSLRAFV